MTTKVTVDAHAGWPVKVEAIDYTSSETTKVELGIVPAGQSRDFHVWQERQLIITEMPRPGEEHVPR